MKPCAAPCGVLVFMSVKWMLTFVIIIGGLSIINEYANTLWAGAYDKDLTKLDSVEVEAMRSVTGATAGSNIANLYKDTGCVPLLERRDIHSLCLLYKQFRGEGPSYLRDLLPPEVGERTDYRYPLRNMNDTDIPFTRLNIFKRSFFHARYLCGINLISKHENLIRYMHLRKA